MAKAKIKLFSTNIDQLNRICNEILEMAKSSNVKCTGAIPLPTKRFTIVTRKSPDGEGTATWERWEMRIHKRLIQLDANERVLRKLVRVQIPENVNIEIELT